MKSEKARQYFLMHKTSENTDENLSDLLEKLSQENMLDWKNFMENLLNAVDWKKINYIKNVIEIGNEPEDIQYILNIHAWARKAFYDSLNSGNVKKLIRSYLLGNYLFLDPSTDFQWENPNKNIETTLRKLLVNIKVRIHVPEIAPYSEKKYYDDYCTAQADNSFKKIFDFFSVIEYGKGYDYQLENFIYALTIISYKINPMLISEIIASCEPLHTRIIFNALDPNQTIVVLKEYNGKNILPLLIGLIHIINPIGNNIYDVLLEKDYDFIDKASLIVKKISNCVETDNLYNYITNISNIWGNKLWHSIFIAFAVRHSAYLDSYIHAIDFSRELGTGNLFCTFCQFMPDEITLDKFSTSIYNKFLEYLLEKRNYENSYCGTNYWSFLVHAVYVKSEKSYTKYSKMLKDVSIDFERTLYSWKPEEVTMCFTKLIFWVITLRFYDTFINNINKIDSSHTIDILSNEKYLDNFNLFGFNSPPFEAFQNTIKSDASLLADFLKNQTGNIIIKLPLSCDTECRQKII